MNAILLVGGGGHCRAAIDVIETQGHFRIEGIVQPRSHGHEAVLGYPFLGEDDDLPNLLKEIPNALVTVGQIKSSEIRRRLYYRLKELNARIPVIASPNAHVSRHAEVGEGTLVMHAAVINAGARIGRNGIVNSLALIEHDAVIGDHCHLSTGSRVNGAVVVESNCFVGSGAILREGVRIGVNSVIGAGCVVLCDVEPNTFMKAQP